MCSEGKQDLVDMAQLQTMLGVSRGRAYTISRDRSFPEPVYESTRFRLWCRAEVIAWLDRCRPKWREEQKENKRS